VPSLQQTPVNQALPRSADVLGPKRGPNVLTARPPIARLELAGGDFDRPGMLLSREDLPREAGGGRVGGKVPIGAPAGFMAPRLSTYIALKSFLLLNSRREGRAVRARACWFVMGGLHMALLFDFAVCGVVKRR